MTAEGSLFRRQRKFASYAQGKWSFSQYIKESNLRTTLTPELNYPDYKGICIPQSIDSEKERNLWSYSNPIIIAHSPTDRYKKGTDNILIPAIKNLRKDFNIQLKLLENLSNQEVIEIKKSSTIFFDQCVVGFYGFAALEAMQYGIPTMAYISKDAFNQSSGELNSCPIINISPSVSDVTLKLKSLLMGKIDNISSLTKLWCDSYHGYHETGTKWIDLYNEVYKQKKKKIIIKKECDIC
jgi:hypothetical protein